MECHLLLKHLFWGLIVLVQINGYSGCFEEERRGLLQFKEEFLRSSSSTTTVHDLLPSWVVDDTKSSDCCQWERVKCNSTTGHVIDLSLHDIRQISNHSYYNKYRMDDEEIWKGIWEENFDDKHWVLNVSLFGVFTELRSLYLSLNLIGGWNENEGFDTLSRLNMLETLDLGFNYFNRSIVQSLSALTSLKNLILKQNDLEGSFPGQDSESLSRLKKLETLDLSFNNFNRSIIQSLSALTSLKHLILCNNKLRGSFPAQELSIFKNLEVLNLRYNGLYGSLTMQELANLRSLKVLILQRNNLNGTLQIQATLDSLEILDLSYNDLVGSIPSSIGALSSLKALSLSGNQLNGSLPSKGLCELKKLVELDLSGNQFEGNLPPCLTNLTSLQFLDLSSNQFTGEVSSSLVASLTSLEYIDLGYNHFEGLFSFRSFANNSKLKLVQFIFESNKFEIETDNSSWVPLFQLEVLVISHCSLVEVPRFLLSQYNLRLVDLSDNNLKGQFPAWLLENNTRISSMDMSFNYFDGQLPENIGKIIPNIGMLDLSRNALEGSLPSSIGDLSNLEMLDASFNNFSGQVPTELLAGCSMLVFLRLSNNNFHGHFFPTQFNLTKLKVLELKDNRFFGTLSNAVSKCSELFYLDISNNYMSGKIPSWIGNFSYLVILILRNNSFRGQVRFEKVPFRFLDLSHNNLSGSLPSLSGAQSLWHIHLERNIFTGSVPKAFLNVSNLLTLDIRYNNLSGNIPNIVNGHSELRILLLKGNRFSGFIPIQLCQLKRINLMDLSKNFFYGSIPECFANISFGNKPIFEFSIVRSTLFGYNFEVNECGSLLKKCFARQYLETYIDKEDEAEFVTKYMPYSYKGDFLDYMSGLDLSYNNLTGEIPHELGKLSEIHALNLSYNQLTGPIPQTFSNLSQLESLDLSHNNLSGEIPSQLIELHFLAVFSVAHNNLSGKVPDRKAQFGTFDASSYEGNPCLCGPPLETNCTRVDHDSSPPPTNSPDVSADKWYKIDLVVFLTSFSVSFLIFFFGVVTVLYVNPYWQRRCFNLIEDRMYTCYYFVVDALHKLSAYLC